MNISLKGFVTRQLITIESDNSVEKALMIMKNHHFRHLPVVNDQNRIIGFVSDRDLYRGLGTDEKFVSDVMSKNIVTFDMKTDAREIVRSMIKYKLSAFLVTSESEIVGIITSEDLLYLLLKFLDDDTKTPTLLEEVVLKFQEFTENFKSPNLITSL
ncbi:MAG: CBS domain-containing protein [Pseudobdellovibrio sp.]